MPSSWGDLVRGGNAARCAVVGGGMMLQAINTFIVVTVLPSVVRDIGGLDYFAWATTLYVIAGLLGGSLCARLLEAPAPATAIAWRCRCSRSAPRPARWRRTCRCCWPGG